MKGNGGIDGGKPVNKFADMFPAVIQGWNHQVRDLKMGFPVNFLDGFEDRCQRGFNISFVKTIIEGLEIDIESIDVR